MRDLTYDAAFHDAFRRAMRRWGHEPETADDKIARRLLAEPKEEEEDADERAVRPQPE